MKTGGGLASLAIRRPVGTLAIASVVFVLGLFFADRLPTDLLPEVEYPMVRVTVNWPGAAPEVMEEQVTRVLERSLSATQGLERIASRASEGRTNVTLVFGFGSNLDVALQDVSRHLELARTQLPPDIEPPRLYKFDPAQDPIWQAGFSSVTRSEVEVRDWIDHHLAPHLIAIPGVAGVEAAGGLVREIEVIVDQERLSGYRLTLRDIASLVAAENADIAGGWVTSERFDVMAKTDGRLTSAAEVADLLVPLPDGTASVRMRDVAEVRDGYAERRMFVRLDGQPAAQVSVFKMPEANTVAVVDAVNATIARLERSGFIPDDIALSPVRDPSFFIRGALAAVSGAALLGGVLAMFAVLLFLGSLRKSLVIGLSIPIALLATFSLMGISGVTLNIISLGGLALGVGLLLDNAIVMLENIARHREKLGKPPDRAAHDAAAEVVSAMTAGTFTNLAAVVPFLLMTGMAALIFRDLIVTLSFAIVTTLVAALTLVPMLATLLAPLPWSSGIAETRPLRAFDAGVRRLARSYRRLLPRVLRLRWGVVALAVMLFAGALYAMSTLGDEFLPQVDDGNVGVRMVLPPGTPPHETDQAARQIERVLFELPGVDTVFTMVGGHLSGGVINERPGTANLGVQLVPAAERPGLPAGEWVREAQARLDALDLPGARISVRPPAIRGLQFSLTGEDFSLGVYGEDLATLRGMAQKLSARLQGVPGLEGVEVGREDVSPLLRVTVDRERASAFGLQVGEVGNALRDAVTGTVPTQIMLANQNIDVRVRLPRDTVADADRLAEVLLFNRDGQPVRLGDVADFSLGDGPAHIERDNQSRVVYVNGDFNTAVADPGRIIAEVERRLAGLEVPDDVSLVFGGQWETIQESNRELRTVIALAVFLVFVVLAVQYERLSDPLVIIAAAPLALIGVAVLLLATGTALSAPVMIGAILLVGIVVNNAILLVEYIESGRENGLSQVRAITRAGHIRLRPILMTTITTVLGMTPLAIGLGSGAEIMRPLALTVVGGLLGAMLLTLFVVPCLYLIINRAALQLRQRLA